MTVSVIIPSYQGAVRILSTIEALEKQTTKDFELIVLVDGSTDNTTEILRRKKFDLKSFQIFEQFNKGRAGARNAGARYAQGDLLIFYDDDMTPNSSSVQMHVEFHRNNSNAVLGGNQMEYFNSDKTDIQNYKAWCCERWTKKYQAGVSKLTQRNHFLTAANMSVLRQEFDLLNGFDERLTDAEDKDFAWRALENNVQVYFDKDNIAIHEDQVTCISYIKRTRQYSFANDKLDILYPNRDSLSKRTTLFKRAIYRLFAFRFWPSWIDKSKLVLLLPQSLRYKLYDIVIQSLGKEYRNVRLS